LKQFQQLKKTMKKIILLTISILMISAVSFAKKSNPIPSYNVALKANAYFQEDFKPNVNTPLDEKRDMTIENGGGSVHGPEGSYLMVYVYRLDGSITLGPFFIPAGSSKTVAIDGNRWGVYAQTNNPTYMSVWTNDNL
jgi:hypothetical protein